MGRGRGCAGAELRARAVRRGHDAVVQGWALRDVGAEWCGRRGRCGCAAALAQGSPPPLPTVAAVYDVTLNFRGNKNPSLLGILYGKKYEADMCVR